MPGRTRETYKRNIENTQRTITKNNLGKTSTRQRLGVRNSTNLNECTSTRKKTVLPRAPRVISQQQRAVYAVKARTKGRKRLKDMLKTQFRASIPLQPETKYVYFV